MTRLYMVGDSFSSVPKAGDDYKPWYLQAADNLQISCTNHSMIGVSQDWCWWKLAQELPTLTPDDQILIVLTHPGRFWFFDDKPQMTNPNIVNIDKELSSEQLEAVKNFMLHIQRPPLDIQQLSHRLGWLEAQCSIRKLKPAHVLCAFPLYIKTQYDMSEHINWTEYKHVLISKGDLLGCVETPEMKPGLNEYELWKGYDCRYNHMIKSNHTILAEAVAKGIRSGEPIDLVSPEFVKAVLDKSVLEDQDFIQKELEPFAITDRKKYLETQFQTPWAEASGLFDIFKKKKV